MVYFGSVHSQFLHNNFTKFNKVKNRIFLQGKKKYKWLLMFIFSIIFLNYGKHLYMHLRRGTIK